jgi:hypothetical protein
MRDLPWEVQLLCMIADDDDEKYFTYLDRLIERVKQGEMSAGEVIRLVGAMSRLEEGDYMRLERLKRLVVGGGDAALGT